MKLSEAKQILKNNGYRLLKESEGYTFRIAGGKISEHLTGGKYQKTLKYDEKDAADELGDDTLNREFTDVNELVKAVVDDLTCLDDKGDVGIVRAGVLQHLDDDSAATLDIYIPFRPVLGFRSKYKNKMSKSAHLVITGNTGAGSVDSDDLATVLKAQLNTRYGETMDLIRSQEYRKFESYRGLNEGAEDSFDEFKAAVEIAMDDDRALTEYSDFYGDTVLNAKKAEISGYIQEYWDNEYWPHKTVADNIDDCVEYIKRKVLDY